MNDIMARAMEALGKYQQGLQNASSAGINSVRGNLPVPSRALMTDIDPQLQSAISKVPLIKWGVGNPIKPEGLDINSGDLINKAIDAITGGKYSPQEQGYFKKIQHGQELTPEDVTTGKALAQQDQLNMIGSLSGPKTIGKKGILPQNIPEIDSDDQKTMSDFIDYARGINKVSGGDELAGLRIAEKYDLPMPKTKAGLANVFDEVLSRIRQQPLEIKKINLNTEIDDAVKMDKGGMEKINSNSTEQEIIADLYKKAGMKPKALIPDKKVLSNSDLIIEDAIKKHGITNNPELAGFITNDGKMIDASGIKQGSQGLSRSVDHREIATDALIDNPNYQKSFSGSEALSSFMDETKSTRISVQPKEINIDILHNPSDQQMKQLEKISKGKTIVADISKKDGSVLKSGTFDSFEEYKKWINENIK